MNESQNYMVLVTGKTGHTAHLCITADSSEHACAQAKSGGYVDAQVISVAHSNNVKGYEIRTFDTELNVTLSTLYAVLADGKILESDTHPIDSIFSRPCRVWTAVSKLPDEAEYIGDYPAVHATPRCDK